MDPVTVMAITSIVGLGVGALGKILYELRHNIKNCGGIVFRSRSTSRNSPRGEELNKVRTHFHQTLGGGEVVKVTPANLKEEDQIAELEKQIRLRELEAKLKRMEESESERVYI